MAQPSKIEWTEMTWNPVRGCSRVSPGCQHCYAERMASRFSGSGRPFEGLAVVSPGGPRWTNRVRLVEELIDQPRRWQKPRTVFVNSMSDLFHHDVPDAFIHRVFATINQTPRHRYQVLTKRSTRLAELAPSLPWSNNIWMGVSIENDDYEFRAERLRGTGAAVKFLSLEPLLGPLPSLALDDIDWVIVGGESGPGARPMDAQWVRDIRTQCLDHGVPIFFKQWGGTNKKRAGRVLDGRTWDDMPNSSPTIPEKSCLAQ